jgi:hypothetical protein
MRCVFTVWIVAAVCLAGCRKETAEKEEVASSVEAMETVKALLELHGLYGRMPDERTDADKKRGVDEQALKVLIADYDTEDPFITNLYVGFVVGALARHQHKLPMTRTGNRAVFHAGKVAVVMAFRDGSWRIVLGPSIPEEIKRRARIEKRRVAEKSVAQAP